MMQHPHNMMLKKEFICAAFGELMRRWASRWCSEFWCLWFGLADGFSRFSVGVSDACKCQAKPHQTNVRNVSATLSAHRQRVLFHFDRSRELVRRTFRMQGSKQPIGRTVQI